MTNKHGLTESDIASAGMDWLIDQKWDCYPEATSKFSYKRADIAAVRDGRLWIVEAKMSCGMAVIEQAYEWINTAHWVSVLVPRKPSDAASNILEHFGIGVLVCHDGDARRIHEWVRPRLHRHSHARAKRFISTLHPDMKRFAPGTQFGYSSPFRRTMDGVIAFIRHNPGCTLKELMDSIEHHYQSSSTARTSTPKWLETGKWPVSVEREGGKMKFYPMDKLERASA